MIKDALIQDKAVIYDMWKQIRAYKDSSDLDAFFRIVYDQGKTVVVEQDDRLIATTHLQSHVVAMKQKRLCVNFISGLMTIPDYRMRGHMGSLMDSVLDESSHTCLFTLMQAIHPQLYEKFGFEVVGWHKQYHIPTKLLINISDEGVSQRYTAEELCRVYEQFTAYFDGYMIRDITYYEQLIQQTITGSLKLCVYRNQNDELIAYALYREVDEEVEVQEILYLESIGLQKLLRFMAHDKTAIQVQVSAAEKLERIFPLVVPRKVPFLMARLNQRELFNKLYGVNIRNAVEAFQMLDKPLFYNEVY